MNEFHLKHLDCSLRDGGYYTRWDFDEDFVNKYLKVIDNINVQFCELGFRFFSNSDFKGPYAFTTEEQLSALDIPKNLKIGIMINASDLILNGKFNLDRLKKIMPVYAKESKVDLVRIACHLEEVKIIKTAFRYLKKLGYLTGCNIMQISEISFFEIEKIGNFLNENDLDVVYLADSLGALDSNRIIKLIKVFREIWSGELGIHAHDNQGLALNNSLQAIKNGISWVDTTITGIGRGPGNAKTEEIIIELNSAKQKEINFVPIAKMIEDDFLPMKKIYGWGTNIYYYLAGKYSIHPSYIQLMISDTRYREEDILTAINNFRNKDNKKYKSNNLIEARNLYFNDPNGTWSPEIFLKDKDVLILGTGPKAKYHKRGLESFIKKTKPKVIALNTDDFIDKDLIDLRVASHPMRLLSDLEIHKKLSQPLVTPLSMLPKHYRQKLRDKDVFDYGLGLSEKGEFSIFKNYCIIPSSLVLAYALALVVSGKVNKIFLAGFDGYRPEDQRNYEINDLISIFKNKFPNFDLISITPSIYKGLTVKSVYGL